MTSRSSLVELGAQSLDFLEVVFRLEVAFGVQLPRRYAVPGKHTVAVYARAVEKQLAVRRSHSPR